MGQMDWISRTAMPENLTIDEYQAQIHRHRWSAGDLANSSSAGVTWMVYAHREQQHIVAKAPSQTEAWREAARLIGDQP